MVDHWLPAKYITTLSASTLTHSLTHSLTPPPSTPHPGAVYAFQCVTPRGDGFSRGPSRGPGAFWLWSAPCMPNHLGAGYGDESLTTPGVSPVIPTHCWLIAMAMGHRNFLSHAFHCQSATNWKRYSAACMVLFFIIYSVCHLSPVSLSLFLLLLPPHTKPCTLSLKQACSVRVCMLLLAIAIGQCMQPTNKNNAAFNSASSY